MTACVRNVLIIGGGFSGMSAAIQLAKQGVPVDLVEIDAGWRSYGAGISLGGATLRAFRTLGVLDEFLREGSAHDGAELLLPDGRKIGSLPTPRLAGPDVPGGGGIMRPVLAGILAAATRAAGVNVRLGQTFSEIRPQADGVEVTFTDGTTGRYDLVVGADGLYSKVRETFFPHAPKPRYTGQGVWRAVLERPASVQGMQMWMGQRHKPGINPVSKTHLYLFLTEDRAVNEHIPAERQVQMLRDLLAPFPDPALQQMREQIGPNSQVIYRPLESMLMQRPWFDGRIVLIGDTVHATTPHLASGACIGIEDGIVLAEELLAGGEVQQALERFQARRWERCRMVVENSGRLGEIEIQGGDKEEHARIMRDSMMALAQPI
jgi:2-polyprenyl-6-methoxyphenol hydroxylase-like FAD-dependent oxidoreductase